MIIYSQYEKQHSLLSKEKMVMDISGGLKTREKDWYPFVMVFNDNAGFSHYINKEVSLTILYNFGAFEYLNGASSYYNPQSPYLSAFYGGYVVQPKDGSVFGFDENRKPKVDEIAAVPKYDLQYLVLNSLGCYDVTLDYQTDAIQQNLPYLDKDDWTRIDASITTNSPVHRYRKPQRAYIQYGKPPAKYYEGEDFPLIKLKGRIYARYYEEFNATAFLYVIAPHEDIIEKTDKTFLSQAVIKSK